MFSCVTMAICPRSERSFARATGANKGDQFAFAGSESNIAQDGSGVVRETNIFKANLAGESGKFDGAGRVLPFVRKVEIGKDLRGGSLRLLELLIDRAYAFDGFVGFKKRIGAVYQQFQQAQGATAQVF